METIFDVLGFFHIAQLPNDMKPLVVPFDEADPVNPTFVRAVVDGSMNSTGDVVLARVTLPAVGVMAHSLDELGANVIFVLTLDPDGNLLPTNAFPSE